MTTMPASCARRTSAARRGDGEFMRTHSNSGSSPSTSQTGLPRFHARNAAHGPIMAIMERDGAARGTGSLNNSRSIMRILRRILVALSLIFVFAAPAAAATPAEALVADNIHKGLDI